MATVWAFNRADDEDAKKKVYESVKQGVSRFGWSSDDNQNLLLQNNWTEWHSKHRFLLDIEVGDWIVHINTPSYGKCITGQVTHKYQYDEGLDIYDDESWIDFRHAIQIDPNTVLEFDRNDPRMSREVNLRPLARYQRVYAVDAFLKGINEIRNDSSRPTDRNFHLYEKTEEFLPKIAAMIQELNRSKLLETYLADVFRKIPNVEVKENGSGWKTDHGADLILTSKQIIGPLEFVHLVVAQVKSYIGQMDNTQAIDDIKKAIKQYSASAGIILSTAKRTKKFQEAVERAQREIGKEIIVISGEELARFVLKYAPELVFKMLD